MRLEGVFWEELRALNETATLRDRFSVICQGHAAAEYIVHDWNLRRAGTVEDALDVVAASIDSACSRFGCAVVGICLASTIVLGEFGCFSLDAAEWAEAVMNVWTNHLEGHLRAVAIRPGFCSSEFAYALSSVVSRYI